MMYRNFIQSEIFMVCLFSETYCTLSLHIKSKRYSGSKPNIAYFFAILLRDGWTGTALFQILQMLFGYCFQFGHVVLAEINRIKGLIS